MDEADKVRGCSIRLRAGPVVADHPGGAVPTLGEIVDMLAAAYPDLAWPCDPALRDVRIGSVVVQDGRRPGHASGSART